MEPRVEVAEGTAFEVLLGAAAVADPDWRDVFATGSSVYAEVLAVAGPDVVRRTAALGRYGWINLIGLLTKCPKPWDLTTLVTAARSSQPDDLHYIAVGGDRRQLVAAVDEPTIRDALVGDRSARDRLAATLASDELVLEISPWLLNSPSVDVHEAVSGLLQTWQDQLLPLLTEAALAGDLHRHAVTAAAQLATMSSRDYLDLAIGGLRYEPAGLDKVLVVASPSVVPIVVVVDGRDHTVILLPPATASRRALDTPTRLLELARAVGDKTRMRLLTELRGGDRTAVDLAAALDAPRTTLLHHLAILRAAGVIHVTVTPGGATVYRLRPESFGELARVAGRFISTE